MDQNRGLSGYVNNARTIFAWLVGKRAWGWSRLIVLFVTCALTAYPAQPDVRPQVINLWPVGCPNNAGDSSPPNLEIFFPFNPAHRALAAVVIFPGGGYLGLSPYERLQAEFFRGLGYTAIVVNYRVGVARFPQPYADALRALRMVRAHASEWGYPPNRIALLGGSAGGHLAALVVTQPELFRDPCDDLADRVSAQPNRLILLYPVIKTSGSDAHVSIERLLGPHPTDTLRDSVSPEKHVSKLVPPTLIFHAVDDPVVNVNNSISFAQACWAAGVSAELHVFPRGGHGRDFAYDNEVGPRWRHLAQEWLALWLTSPSSDAVVPPR